MSSPSLPYIDCGGGLPRPTRLSVGGSVLCRGTYRVTHRDVSPGVMELPLAASARATGAPIVQVASPSVAIVYSCATCATCIADFAVICERSLPLAGRPTNLAAAIAAACIASGRPAASCASLERAIIEDAPRAWLGLRAGRVCGVLGECGPAGAGVPGKAGTCGVPAANTSTLGGLRLSGSIDLCTVQGVAGGDFVPGSSNILGTCHQACKDGHTTHNALCCNTCCHVLKVYCTAALATDWKDAALAKDPAFAVLLRSSPSRALLYYS
jgi:hypothetical protein